MFSPLGFVCIRAYHSDGHLLHFISHTKALASHGSHPGVPINSTGQSVQVGSYNTDLTLFIEQAGMIHVSRT